MKTNVFAFLFFLLLLIGCKETSVNSESDSQTTVAQNSTEELLEKAIQNYKTGNFEHAESQLKEILATTPEKGNEAVYIRAYTNLGNVYADKGNNPTALDYYNKALKTSEEINDRKNIAYIQKNIGTLYVSWKQFDKAIEFYNETMKTAREINDEILVADCYNNVGIIYEQQEKFNKAVEVYSSALKLYEKNALKEGIAMAESNLAIVYKLQKDFQSSLKHNLNALKVSEEIQDKWTTSSILNNVGNLYREMGNYQLAEEYAQRGLDMAKEMNAQEIMVMAYETLAKTAQENGDDKKAIVYYLEQAAVKDSFINTESTRQFSDLQVKYETEKKEKDLAETQLKLSRKEIVSQRKNIWLIMLGGLVLLGGVLFQNFRVKSRLKQEQLVLENQLLEEKSYVEIQQQRLDISRELHDSVGSQLTFIHSILDSMKNSADTRDEKTNEKINTLSEFSGNSISELRDTIWVLNSKELRLSELKMKMLNFVQNASDSTEFTDLHFEFNFEKDRELNSKQAVNIFRVFQEITNNALKYAKAKDIFIRINQIEDQFEMDISDNGTGFDFDKKKNNSFGLSNIQNRIWELNGKVEIDSAEGKGTRYRMVVPI